MQMFHSRVYIVNNNLFIINLWNKLTNNEKFVNILQVSLGKISLGLVRLGEDRLRLV